MNKTKLYSHSDKTKGTTTTLPVVGEVNFSKDDNSIEVDSSKVEALLLKDFGILLSVDKEMKVDVKKVSEKDTKKQEDALLNSIPTSKLKEIQTFLEQEKFPLAEIFELLKKGRGEEEIGLLSLFIDELNPSSVETKDSSKAKPQTDQRKMLDNLSAKELDSLIEDYPEDKRPLLTGSNAQKRTQKIDFLEAEMLKPKA